MVSGHPDWQTWEGRNVGGENVTSYSFSGTIAAGVTGTIDMPIVAAGYRNTYQNIIVSCNDDSAIHNTTMIRVSDAWVFFEINFINGGIFDYPGQSFAAGTTVRVLITNNAAVELTFEGSVFYTSTKV